MNLIVRTLLTIALLAVLPGSLFGKGPKKPPAPTVPWKDVPAAVQTTIQNNLAGGKVKEVTKETVSGVLYYYGEVKGTDGKWMKICVRDTGVLVKIEPDNARNKRKHKPLFG